MGDAAGVPVPGGARDRGRAAAVLGGRGAARPGRRRGRAAGRPPAPPAPPRPSLVVLVVPVAVPRWPVRPGAPCRRRRTRPRVDGDDRVPVPQQAASQSVPPKTISPSGSTRASSGTTTWTLPNSTPTSTRSWSGGTCTTRPPKTASASSAGRSARRRARRPGQRGARNRAAGGPAARRAAAGGRGAGPGSGSGRSRVSASSSPLGAGGPALRHPLVVLGQRQHAVGVGLLQLRVDLALLAVADPLLRLPLGRGVLGRHGVEGPDVRRTPRRVPSASRNSRGRRARRRGRRPGWRPGSR